MLSAACLRPMARGLVRSWRAGGACLRLFQSDATNKGQRLAQKVDWSNPRERLPYVSDETLYALPPRHKPWKWSDRERRWKQFRARVPFGVLVLLGCAYAAYLHVNDRGMGRLRLVRGSPQLAAVLERLGVLRSLPQSVNLDRVALFRRVFLKYAVQGTLEAKQACALIQEITGPSQLDDAALSDSHDEVSLWGFVAAASAVCAPVSDQEVYLACLERLGVPAVDPEGEAELAALYDFVVDANGGSAVFTVPYLAALADELGFAGNEEYARHFLTESSAVQTGALQLRPTDWLIADASAFDRVATRRALALPSLPASAAGHGRQNRPHHLPSGVEVPDGSMLLVRSHVQVPVSRDEWVNFMGAVMSGCSTDDIRAACEVFTYLQSARPS